MSSSLGDYLTAARRRYFVGRENELALFERALSEPELPFFVLSIFGPGGVGKTTLLRELLHICDRRQTQVVLLDARELEPAPQPFLAAIGTSLNLENPAAPLEALTFRGDRLIILVDTYESLAPLDDWIRGEFLPKLSQQILTVFAGRQPPPPAWRADPAWQNAVRLIPLRNLSPADGQSYLSKRQIPVDLHRAVLDFTHGHPLALSLVADTLQERPEAGLQFERTPDVVQVLLEKFVRQVSDPEQRAALEVASLVRTITEPLLARMTGAPDSHGLFRWLQTLSFVEARPGGLFLHDLAREVLVADLRWRDPDRYAELHRRARVYFQEQLAQSFRSEQPHVLWDYIFLHRDNAVVRPFFDWQTSGGLLIERPAKNDLSTLQNIVHRHEGETSAQIAGAWFDAQPEGFRILRDRGGEVAGFYSRVTIGSTRAELSFEDPAYEAASRYLDQKAALRPGEIATMFRFWMAADSYQAVSPVQSLIFVSIVRHYLTTPGLAFSFFPCADPEFWAAGFAYGNLNHIPEVDFEIDGRKYGVYGHDWRVEPPLVWLELLAEREIATDLGAASRPQPRPALVVLSQEEFTGAVRDFLRAYHRPEALSGNPLLYSRLVVDGAGIQADIQVRVARMRQLVGDAIAALESTAKGRKFSRAVHRTYLQPEPTQERAAEALGLPFSTYRRHLQTGIQRVTAALWDLELGIPGSERSAM